MCALVLVTDWVLCSAVLVVFKYYIGMWITMAMTMIMMMIHDDDDDDQTKRARGPPRLLVEIYFEWWKIIVVCFVLKVVSLVVWTHNRVHTET